MQRILCFGMLGFGMLVAELGFGSMVVELECYGMVVVRLDCKRCSHSHLYVVAETQSRQVNEELKTEKNDENVRTNSISKCVHLM